MCACWQTYDKGWGLFAKSDLTRLQFLIGYVGEIIDVDECERRIASLMWVVGVIRRGVEWQENSPILRLIDKTLADEHERGAPLGPNVARMIPRRRPAALIDHADLDLA